MSEQDSNLTWYDVEARSPRRTTVQMFRVKALDAAAAANYVLRTCEWATETETIEESDW